MLYFGKTSVQKMNIEKRILQLHKYKITPPPSEKGRWQTYITHIDGTRHIVRASTYDCLMEKLFDHYFNGVSYSNMRLQHVFEEWLEYKSSITDSTSTIRRHEQHWNKYFREWSEMKLKSFDKLTLQKMCNQLVKSKEMTNKEWQNIKTILTGVFWYALEKDYIKTNPMDGLKITVKFRQVNKKSGSQETFVTDEYFRLHRYFDAMYSETADPVWLALKLDLYIGLRVSELSSLMWQDVHGLRTIHICREEVRNPIKSEKGWHDAHNVVEHTKTHTDRIIPLVPAAVAILNKLKMDQRIFDLNGYIFVRDGVRITSRQITYALEKACNSLGIDVKRTHKIRKTVASRLNAGGVPLDAIREFLGHSTTSTTLGYIYNPLTEKETYNKMTACF